MGADHVLAGQCEPRCPPLCVYEDRLVSYSPKGVWDSFRRPLLDELVGIGVQGG